MCNTFSPEIGNSVELVNLNEFIITLLNMLISYWLKGLIHRRVSLFQKLFWKKEIAIKCYDAVLNVLVYASINWYLHEKKKISIKSKCFSDTKNSVFCNKLLHINLYGTMLNRIFKDFKATQPIINCFSMISRPWKKNMMDFLCFQTFQAHVRTLSIAFNLVSIAKKI